MIRLGKIGGAEVRMHAAFPVLAAAACMLGYGRVLAMLLPVLCLHELGHAGMAALLRLRVTALELTPFGGLARVEGMSALRPWQEALVALAGPLVNLLLAMGAALAVYAGALSGARTELFVRCNLVLMACNLLPALPLDGGRIARALCAGWMGRTRATRCFAWAGCALGVLLWCAGLYGVARGVVNVTLFGGGAYLGYAATCERRALSAGYVRALSRHADVLARGEALPVRTLAMSERATVRDAARAFWPRYYHRVQVLDAGMKTRALLTEDALLDALLQTPERPLGEMTGDAYARVE